MPKRSTSYLGPEAAPNSTLQHAVSRCTGHSDQTLPQFIAYPSGVSNALTSTSLSLLTKRLKFVGLTSSFFTGTVPPLYSFRSMHIYGLLAKLPNSFPPCQVKSISHGCKHYPKEPNNWKGCCPWD